MEKINSLNAISPIDGRYRKVSKELTSYFSEYGLIKFRVDVEVRYLVCLVDILKISLTEKDKKALLFLSNNSIGLKDAEEIKKIEKITNHDVKAVEYFLKSKLNSKELQEFVHFGLTSQDVNNTALPLSILFFMKDIYIPYLHKLINKLKDLSKKWSNKPMLARTHGQAATPTTVGKEFAVFQVRLITQLNQLQEIPVSAKFGGATGNFNAHHITYPDIDWHKFADKFIKSLGLTRLLPTTQIEHYDNLAALFHCMARINTILIDFSRDIWTYISMDYFKQKIKSDEVGSSAMPHKVNPIDFENAEGNLGVANALFSHLSAKLPISRLQRDLTDSTVSRNIGVPLSHSLIAFSALQRGLSKLILNQEKLKEDLNNNWMVVAEAIQTILRREGYPRPYEKLKEFARGNHRISKKDIHMFVESLDVNDSLKKELKLITPEKYLGPLDYLLGRKK